MTHAPTPKHGILSIAPYVGGKSTVAGVSKIIKLASNENPWGASPKASAAFAAMAAQLHRYPDGAHASLREAIGKAYQLPAAQLICGSGSDELIGLLIHAYAGKCDEVLMSKHGFLMYKLYALGNSADVIMAEEKNLHADVDALLAAVTPRTKIVFLANPNNPTGTYIPYAEVQRLRAGLRADIILGLDAAYAEYMQAEDYNTGYALVRESNTVVMHTFSKIYGIPALRLGWAYGPPEIIDVLNRVRGPFNVNAAALAAGIAAVEDQEYVKHIIARNRAERERVASALHAHGLEVLPSHTNFVLVKFGTKAAEANQFLQSRGIIIRDVQAYGLPEYLRISIGTEEENTALLEALAQFFSGAKAA
jgi:histidinol-phosphate aminotransferase